MCYAAFAAHQKFCLLSFKDAKRKSYRGRIIGFVCDFSLAISTASLVGNSYNPFLYFRF